MTDTAFTQTRPAEGRDETPRAGGAAPWPARSDGREAREMARRCSALVRASAKAAIASPVALEAWVATLYQRDEWTLAHVGRVAGYAVAIAGALGMSRKAADEVGRAALLHDVGRLAIPDDLILKPEALTEADRALVRSAVQVAHDVAAASPYLAPLAGTLLAVRERFDGTGYPLGLRGASIPLSARVIAVAEAFDSLAACRDEDCVSIDRVNAELVRASGSLFDPFVVRGWLSVVDGRRAFTPAPGRAVR
jgi:response regulator RpfG family c-di-GMP phosphodiesterase